ncbi:hypothetical protein BH10ACT9_BH10ACT9_32720 [soil metagenome]
MSAEQVDVVIVGGGHNGLTAAAYLAGAGLRVQLLERQDHVGGAAVSARAFPGVDARLSRYSYLVSLLPTRIIDDLGLRIRLARRRYSSHTPYPAAAGATGLLVGPESTFAAVGAGADEAGFDQFYRLARTVTEPLWPTLLEPLPTHRQARDLVGARAAWDALVEQPIGAAIRSAVNNDLVRGVIATDALIGTFVGLDDTSLEQNICLLYHLLGGGTGDWDVPIGGMGAVTGALAAAAAGHGADIVTGADVHTVTPEGSVGYRFGDESRTVQAQFVLVNVTPTVLAGLLGEPAPDSAAQGAQVKVNLMLRRLPRLRDRSVTPEQAFGGTFHINETWTQLDAAYVRAAGGAVPGTQLTLRDLMPLPDRPPDPLPRAPGRQRAHPHGIRSAHSAHPALCGRG